MQNIAVAMCFHIDPPDQPVAFKQGKDIIAITPLRLGDKNFDPVMKAKQTLCPRPVAQRRVKRAQYPQPPRGRRQPFSLLDDIRAGKHRARLSTGTHHVDRLNLSPSLLFGAPGFGLCRRNSGPKGRQLSRGCKPQPVKRGVAQPVDGLVRIRAGLGGAQVGLDHPLRQVIPLLKSFTPDHGDLTGAPEIFQRGFGGVPIPPTAAGAFFILAHIRRSDRAVIADMLQNRLELRVKFIALPAPPAPLQRRRITLKAQMPMRIKRHRNNSRIMSPVLKKRAVALIQPLKMRCAISRSARKQDHVMRAGDRVDAVELNKAEFFDQGGKISAFARACRRLAQSVTMQKNLPRRAIVQRQHRHA